MTDAETIAALRQELENYATANHALRVELYVTQQNLAAQGAATASLARGAAAVKNEHLFEMAQVRAQLGAALARIADLERAR